MKNFNLINWLRGGSTLRQTGQESVTSNTMWRNVAMILLLCLGVGNAWGAYSYNAATSVPAWTIQFNSWYGESDASGATAATVHNPRLYWNGSAYKNNNSTASAIAFDDDGFYYIYNHNAARELPTGDALSALCYVLFKNPGSYFKYNKSSGSFSVSSGGDELTVYGLTFNTAVATGVQLEIHAPQEGYVRMLIGTNTNTYRACTATLSGATTGIPSINSLAANASYGVKTKSGGSFSTTTYYSRGARTKYLEFAVNSGTTTVTINPADMVDGSSTARNFFLYAIEVYQAVASGNTLSFDANGGTGTIADIVGTGSQTLPSSGFTNSGYTLAGWATSDERADAGTVDYALGGSYTLSADATLHAVWQVKTPSISFSDDTDNEVTITCATSDVSIYYTTNGTTPTTGSTLYDGTFTIRSNKTIKAIAVKANYKTSEVASLSCTHHTATRKFKSGERIYFKDDDVIGGACMKYSGNNLWAVFDGTSDWIAATKESGTWDAEGAIYYFDVPGVDQEYDFVIFTRNDWGIQTGNETTDVGKNMFVLTSYDNNKTVSGTWSKYVSGAALIGDFNEWNPDEGKFVDGRVILDLEADTDYEFKVLVGDGTDNNNYWSCSLCPKATNTVDPWQQLYSNQNNWSMHSAEAGEYCFHWNNDTHYLGIYYPQARFTKNKYIYFDARSESNWKESEFASRFWFKYYDSGSAVSDTWCAKASALEEWVFYTTIPDNDYVGQVQVNRYSAVDGTYWNDANISYASTRTSSKQNCMVAPSSGWSGINLTWGTYCPPMSAASLSDNSTSLVSWQTGNGTSGNPYLVSKSGTIKVSASATKAVPDANMTPNYNFKVSDNGASASSAQSGTGSTYDMGSLSANHTYEFSLEAWNAYNNTTGAKHTTATHLWYKAVQLRNVTHALSGVTKSAGRVGENQAADNEPYTATFAASTGYDLPATITVKFGSTTKTAGTDYTWNSSTGDVSIPASKINGNVTITVTGVAKTTTIKLDDNDENNGASGDGTASVNYDATAVTSITHTTPADGYQRTGYWTNKTGGYKVLNADGTFATYSSNISSYISSSNKWCNESANITLYAQYEIINYTVTFAVSPAGYGSVDVSEITGVSHGAEVSIDDNVLTLKETDVTATAADETDFYTYAFDGWSVDDGDAITSTQTITASFTREAKTYTISYNLNSGSWVSSAKEDAAPTEYTAGVGATLPDDTYVARDGYTFLGWVSQWDLDNTKPPYTPISAVDDEAYGDVEYVAQWESSTFSVTYNGDSPTSGSAPSGASGYEGDGTETVTVAGDNGMSKTGYDFRGWSDGTTFFLTGQSFTMPNHNVTLTAVWEPTVKPAETLFSTDFSNAAWSGITSICAGKNADDEAHNGITFHSYSGDNAGKPFAVDNSAGTLTWCNNNLSSNYWLAIPVTGVNGSLTITVDNASTATLFNYVIKQETSVSGSGGSGSANAKSASDPATYTKESLTKSDYVVYLGRSSSSYTTVTSISITTPGADGHFDISFANKKGFGGTSSLPGTIVGVEDGLVVLAPSNPTATGYTFGGWYDDEDCSDGHEVTWGSMEITADTKIYAKWTAKTTSVTLDANTANHGSTGSSVTATYDSALPSFSPATPSGAYALEGYYTTASGEGVKIINADGTLVSGTTAYTASGVWKSVESSLTLYARYVTAYSVTYNKNGATSGTAPSDATYYAGGSTVTAKDTTGCKFVYAGHVFRGWNTADNGSGTYYAPGDKFTISGNTTLYAVWVAGTAGTVTYNLKMNSSSTTLDDCTSATPTSGDLTASTTINTYGDADAVAEASAKSSETQKLKIDAEYTAANYYEWTCAVASGKTFTPSQVVMKFQAVSGLTQYKVVLTDGTTSYDSAFVQTTSAGGTLETLTWNIAEGNAFVGGSTMKLRLWAYKKESKATAFRLGSPITIKGIIKPETYTITYKDKGDVDFSGSHTDSPSAHPTSHTYGAATTLNSATKVGYTFGGWFDNADCDGDAVTILGATAVTSNVTLYAKWNPVTLTFTGNGSGVKWDWKNADNWTPACVPTIEHDVVIQKPVEVSMYGAGNIAKAKSIVIDKYNGATGKLTIDGRFGLVVAETIQMKNEEGNLVAPTSADLHIESTSDYQNGALAVKGFTEASGKDINATVIYYTKSHVVSGWSVEGEYDGFYLNQFIGTPLRTSNIYDYYGCWIYKWDPTADDGKGDWKYESTSMTPFQGYDILNDLPASPSYWLTGPLVYSDDQELDLTFTGLGGKNGSENMFANSWMAPIDVTQFRTTDFAGGDETKMEATIYVFNSGTPNNWEEKEDLEGTYPGQFLIMTPFSEAYTGGISEIQSMQAFSVYAKDEGATLTLNYDRLVYQPLLNRSTEIQAMRAPRRAKAESELDAPEIMRIRVKGEQSADKIHLLIRDDFSEGFDNGWDASKMFGMSFAPQLYVITGTGKELSINCTPDAEGTILGFRKGEKDSVYTFTFEYDGAEIFYLNDLKAQTSTLISAENTYEFTAEADDAEARFIISATPIHKTATGVDQTSGNTQDAKVRKVIINDHVYIIRGGRMYSVEGTMLK